MNIYEKILCLQQELKVPKSQYNSFGGYNYRNAEDILETAKPLCKKYGLLLTLSDSLKVIGERYYVEATARVINIEESTETYAVTAYAREEETKKGMDGSQITGASSSYARKYALNGLFNIDDTKDSDTTNKGDTLPQNGKSMRQPTNTQKDTKAAHGVNDSLKTAMEYKFRIGENEFVLGNLSAEWLEKAKDNPKYAEFKDKIETVLRAKNAERKDS